MEPLEPAEPASSALWDRGAPHFQPSRHLTLEPTAGPEQQEAALRSFSRRAARAVRPFVQGNPDQKLWLIGFDESCRLVGLHRLDPDEHAEPVPSTLTVLGKAHTMGARAIVLVENRPGPVLPQVAADLLPTLKIAIGAELFGLKLVDHILMDGGGMPFRLRTRSALTEAQELTAWLRPRIEALAQTHRAFGVSQRALKKNLSTEPAP